MLPATLIVEDEPVLARNLCTYLTRHGFEARTAGTAAQAEEALEAFKPDAVLLDYHLPDMDGLDLLERIRTRNAHVRVVMMTGEGSVEVAVRAMKAGAYDYLAKPLELKAVKLLLERIPGQERIETALDYYLRRDADDGRLANLLGDSEPMAVLKSRIRQLLDAEARLTEGAGPTVLITGETGTGKELVARALHSDGPRRAGAFVEVNCSAIPSHLLEAELFGYERGAFTDARERKLGLVEVADGGTLFLDEVGDTDPSVQTKLLRLLEDRRVRRLGGLRDKQVDVRIIAATNRPLEQLVGENRFRSDLYFRLRVVQLQLPPLRERGDDILLLANRFMEQHAARYRRGVLRLGLSAQEALLDHTWPGNVRELKNVMEQAVLLAGAHQIERDHLPFAPQPSAPADRPAAGAPAPEDSLDLAALERNAIRKALAKTRGNVTRAAGLLGLSRDTLRYRLRRLGIDSTS